MRPSLYIAWQYAAFNKGKTATLVACVTLIAILPIALELLLDESERQLRTWLGPSLCIRGFRHAAFRSSAPPWIIFTCSARNFPLLPCALHDVISAKRLNFF